jgi:hypothetical protein
VSLSILNVGEGDTKLTFDKEKPGEVERTRRVITDMLKLGYAILVRVGTTRAGKPKYRRAVGFDPTSDEYYVQDVPPEAPKKRGRPRRVPASGTPAIAVARSAGGMSDRADSIEMHNMESFDSCAHTRNVIRELASMKDQWAGIPLPLEDAELVVEPRYPLAHVFKRPEPMGPPEDFTVRNRFYSHKHRRDVVVYETHGKEIGWAPIGMIHHIKIDFETMGASCAWGIEQEANALKLLAEMLPHHAFKKYLLTGMFLETSERSGVTYIFRRLKPTVACSGATGEIRILAVLCQHPIAYYSGTWAGAMCPTDDVIAHLSLMRGDEALYWRRCNQHGPLRQEAGL